MARLSPSRGQAGRGRTAAGGRACAPIDVLIARWRRLPIVDPLRLRDDLDRVLDFRL